MFSPETRSDFDIIATQMKITALCKLAIYQPAEMGQKQLVCSQPERKTAAKVHSVTFPTLNEALTSKSLTL